MSFKAGFAEINITPPVGTHKIGWIKDIISTHVLDPLFTRPAVFQNEPDILANATISLLRQANTDKT